MLSFLDAGAYKNLIREDGPVEYGSAVLWILAAVLTGFTVLVSGKTKTRLFIVSYAFMMTLAICCAGEELSWGQRLFGFQGPDAIVNVNKQRETTLHNIGSISLFSNAFLLLSTAVFLVYPYCATTFQGFKRRVLVNNLPVVAFYTVTVFLVSLAAWIIIGIRFGTLGFHPFSLWGHYTQMDDEVFELFAAYSFFALAVLDLTFKRMRSRQIGG
jgi:uncharacterized protein with PQ loop repeat